MIALTLVPERIHSLTLSIQNNLVRAAALLVLVGLAAPLQAQNEDSKKIDDARAGARMHIGPMYVTPQLVLKQFGVDSNVFNTTVNPKSDFTLNVSPTFNVAVPITHRALITATESTDLVYFATYGTERSVDPNLRGREEFYAERITLFAEESVLSTRQRPNFDVDVRSRRVETAVRAGANAHLTTRFSVELSAERTAAHYNEGASLSGLQYLQTSLNRTVNDFSLTPRFRLTPYTTIALQAERFREQFTLEPTRNRDNLRLMPGVEFNPRALISGQAYVGYQQLKPAQPALLPAYEGAVANVGLSYRLLTTTRLNLAYVRDLVPSAELLQPYFVENSYGLSIRRALGRSFDAILHGQIDRYHFANYLPDYPGAADLADRVDRTVSYSASLGYILRRGVRLGFTLTSYDRSSPLPGRSASGLRFGTELNYGL